MSRALPQPERTRWQPLRAGLIDLFYYDAEEFWFHDGRLLLRGNNGTGKSKVLALTLPFLLDGELSPHRVEPDADPKKKMEWNLLLGGAHPYPERLGYTWLEFGRLLDDGSTEFRTLGCGMKAVAGKGISRHWFFVTSLRPGDDLSLMDNTGTALSKDRLAEALGEQGTTYETARAYRRAVDESLFHLGEQRYGALVDLLVQLRQPQLSKRPSEKALSDALTEALPPLDQAVVADVAEAFRSLEEDRDALVAMTEAHSAADTFLDHYRRYASIASRRRVALPRKAQSVYEAANRALAEAETAHSEAQQALVTARTALAELETERERLQAREQTLRTSPEMRDARELERAAEDARRLTAEAERLSIEATQAVGQVEKRRTLKESADAKLSSASDALASARRSTLDAAAAAMIELPITDEPDDTLRSVAENLATRQENAVRHVEQLLAAAGTAAQAVVTARAKVEELAADASELADRRLAATEAVARRGSELVAAMRHHLAGFIELSVDQAGALAALELWCETLDGPNPARTAIDTAGQEAANRLATVDAALDQREQQAQARKAEVSDEIARLESGEDNAPPSWYTRDPATRVDRAGAPLWQLVDFADDIASEDRAGVEAALEASGILDAWVTPAGEVLSQSGDVLVRPTILRPRTSLRGPLVAAVDRENEQANAVSDETVSAVLASIGFGEQGETWVTPDGRFQLGVLSGSWHKESAEYIGQGARETARRARLAILRTELSEVESALAGIEAERSRLAERRRTLSAELAGVPDDNPLRGAHATVAALLQEHERLAARQADALEALNVATDKASEATAALLEGASDLGLPATEDELAAVRRALGDYRVALAGLWPAIRSVIDTRQTAADASVELIAAEEESTARRIRSEERRLESIAAAEKHATLRETVGAAVAELERRLAAVAEQLRDNAESRGVREQERDEAVAAKFRAEGRKEELTGKLADATAERIAAAESMGRFAATGLLTIALPDLPMPSSWAPDPTVRLARQIDRELADFPDDDPAWDRAQRRVTDEFKTLTDTLARQGNTASAQLLEDGIVVEVVFRGRSTGVPELAAALLSEVEDRSRLLDEREREILENHLVNEVASTLQELISEAEHQVALMNAELADRPTSTGMRLRLLWVPRDDGPAGLTEARERLLRQTSDAWSEEDRAAVGGFLQARINEVRLKDVSGTWLEHLTSALDYRTWNRFVIQRHQNGQWRPATGPASGGERVLAASVPLFAAASAHYASAGSPHAPRLVTLDEAFAGVDDNARAKYLGLLAAFDLDVVMTSEREWGCYPEVPGLAIAQLSRTDDIAAVLVTNWQWNGRTRTKVARPE